MVAWSVFDPSIQSFLFSRHLIRQFHSSVWAFLIQILCIQDALKEICVGGGELLSDWILDPIIWFVDTIESRITEYSWRTHRDLWLVDLLRFNFRFDFRLKSIRIISRIIFGTITVQIRRLGWIWFNIWLINRRITISREFHNWWHICGCGNLRFRFHYRNWFHFRFRFLIIRFIQSDSLT